MTDEVELRIVSAVNAHVDKRFDAMMQYIDKKVDPIVQTQAEHTETLGKHTGFHADHAVALKRLDEERLVGIHRMDRLEHDITELKTQVAAS